MKGREAYPDEELRRRIMDFIMAAGQTPVSYTHLDVYKRQLVASFTLSAIS